ncbi:peptidoglycan DD-metalloendopeptidase family protein [Gemmobacter fulvus]|uniref:murein hydrolase activator EnvC family protein n=1 Tax=Gemmobacter fulvus TaxID=2840474 RepID=UPI00279653DB|nr:peptidoglycan DD-metalloendopeptidase family protein [Gemmobacter fulvus]MDQ1848701.1 peptidoglycan DD-metalloendopeptidase family protein [Gemmobacter fulvus]
MIRRSTALAFALCLAFGGAAHAVTVAEQAQAAAVDLQKAVQALDAAREARDRVQALTQTIGAYELGLGALRENLRQASIREATLVLQFEAKRDRVAQLVGVLSRMEADPAPLLLLHPSGPLGTVRSGMMIADVTPALQAEAEAMRVQLQEVRDLRALQVSAGKTLSDGLRVAQEARTALSKAISDRTELPRRFTEDPEVLRGLLESADTLDAFADGLALNETESDGMADFGFGRGKLPLPVLGTLLRRPDEADGAGVRRPGMVLATRKQALVTAPWSGTIRYRGPLLNFGNVIILEPGAGYLLVLAGLETVYGEVGEVIASGAPLGLMGGGEPGMDEFLVSAQDGGGARDTETLYVELRQGSEPVDPMPWFAATAPLAEAQQEP